EIADRLDLSPERVQEIQASSRQPVSLETPLGNEDSAGTLGDLIADRSVRSPHEMAAQGMLKRHMEDAMQVLSPRERQVLRSRYGLSGGAGTLSAGLPTSWASRVSECGRSGWRG